MTLGTKLKTHRERNKMSQNSVADQLNVSRQAISKWENDHGFPDIENLVRLSKLYQVSIDELLHENEELQQKIETNNSKITETKKKLKIVQNKPVSDNDESLGLLLLSAIASVLFPLGILLCLFILWRNRKSNTFYGLVYVVCIISLLLNIQSGYIHIANIFNWGDVQIEKIE